MGVRTGSCSRLAAAAELGGGGGSGAEGGSGAAPDSSGQESVDDLVSALLTASRALVGVSARSLMELDDAVTVPQFRTLVVLDSSGEMHLNRLAEQLGVNSSSAVRMIDRLLAAGLVTRRANPENRRQVILGLSDAGRAAVRTVTAARRAAIAGVVERMHPSDRSGLVAALRAFADAAGEPGVAPTNEVRPLGW